MSAGSFMGEQAGAVPYDAFGEASFSGRDARASALSSMRSAAILFWTLASLLLAGRLYVELHPAPPDVHAAPRVAAVPLGTATR